MAVEILIDGRELGNGKRPFIIAEMSGNHNNDIQRALAIIEQAKAAGADAVKLQTYTADTMTIDFSGPGFIIEEGLWAGRKLYDLYQEAHTPWEWHPRLFARGRELGLTVFSTPFDETAIDYLEQLGAPAYKIASFEVTDLPLIKRAASTGKPLIISTGMATTAEIQDALNTARDAGLGEVILLHCVSAYPTPPEAANLARISQLASHFEVPVGLSDHTLGIGVAVAATALGAVAIEKHFTLSRADGGVDSPFSLEPEEFRVLVENVRTAHCAISGVGTNYENADASSKAFRRSLYVVKDVQRGEPITVRNVRAIRPGFGLPPKHLQSVLGKRAARNISRGEPLCLEMIEE